MLIARTGSAVERNRSAHDCQRPRPIKQEKQREQQAAQGAEYHAQKTNQNGEGFGSVPLLTSTKKRDGKHVPNCVAYGTIEIFAGFWPPNEPPGASCVRFSFLFASC